MRCHGAALGLVAFALAGCAGPPPPSEVLTPARGLSIQPAAAGLDVVPTGREIGFGRFQPGAIAAVSRVVGREPAPGVTRTTCGPRPLTEVRWPRDDLALYFAESTFVGWATASDRAGEACPLER